MIKPSIVAALAWGLLAYGVAMADGQATLCVEPTLPNLHLDQTNCDVEGGISTFTFSDSEPTSPYTTDFDRRRVVIAKATSMAQLKITSGQGTKNRALPSTGVQLLSPPFEDQIVQRQRVKNSVKKRGWHIVTERVSYGAQGGALGFVLDCSTAIRWWKTYVVAVAECHPLEEQQRFIKTLELIQCR